MASDAVAVAALDSIGASSMEFLEPVRHRTHSRLEPSLKRYRRYVDYDDIVRSQLNRDWQRSYQASDPGDLFSNVDGLFAVTYTPPSSFQELLDSKLAAAKRTIDWHAGRDADPRIVVKARELVQIAREEYPEYEIPKTAALNAMFLVFRPRLNLLMPTITPTQAGGIWTQWRTGARAAAAEFRPDGLVNLAALYPDPRLMRRIATNGQFSWQGALEELRSNRGFTWLTQPRRSYHLVHG